MALTAAHIVLAIHALPDTLLESELFGHMRGARRHPVRSAARLGWLPSWRAPAIA